ncbi:ATP-binding protein [Streptomyces sp. ISL-12]|uniref:ATP-binding protein n=1 Tax=Streptomyces sp. ISL-12 TaxID=2819177 RepID=UPI001BE9A8EF|nr:ATP-binding protein [Streptomyces sp. ISL-12]MBT2413287.1 ATP-binding protein [Streptomyces sp. ISL-12]
MREQPVCSPGGDTVHGEFSDAPGLLFVGRTEERAVFRSALRGEREAPAVLYLHGMTGSGKSALLRRFARDAAGAGRTVLEADGGRFAAPRALTAALGNIEDLTGPVLLVDEVDRCEGLAPWLREGILPALSEDAIVVLVGRRSPEPAWTADPGWARHARTRRLTRLADDEADRLLDSLLVPRPLRTAVKAFAAGHPLALRAAAADALTRPVPVAGTGTGTAWSPAPSTTSFLFGRLVGPAPTALQRRTLAVAAAARVVTEGHLRADVGSQATYAFQWLRTQPYTTPVAEGLRMSEVLVHVVLAERARQDACREGTNLPYW